MDPLAVRRRVLFTMLTALDFRYAPGPEPPLIPALRAWFTGWPGIGRIVAGLTAQGLDLQLARHGTEGWRATFYPAGLASSGSQARARRRPEPARAAGRCATCQSSAGRQGQ